MYNVGIIGLGQIAYSIDNDPARKITWSHINAYKKSKDTQVISICDIDETQVKKISQECDIYSGYTDYREMLKNEDLDIVSICTPINTHVQIIKDCIKHNVKAIFCEKTISYSLDDSSEIVELCKENNVVLAVNHVRRWDDFNQKIKNIITQDNYGDIYTIDCYGGTALHTSTSHLIDLMCFFSDSEPEWSIGCKQQDYVRNVHGVHDYGGTGFIKFKNGIIGIVKSNSSSEFNICFEIDIACKNGRVIITDAGDTCEFYKFTHSNSSSGSHYKTLSLVHKIYKNQTERMINAVNNIVMALKKDQQVKSTGQTSLASIKIISGILSEEKTLF